MSRFKFDTAEAHIVVDPAGFFDVFASADRPTHQRPAYRGEIGELGREVSDGTGLTARPGSAKLHDAVSAWASAHGIDAVNGKLGLGRQGEAPLTAAEQKAVDDKALAKKAARDEAAAETKATKKR
jgi:hypothetical protein